MTQLGVPGSDTTDTTVDPDGAGNIQLESLGGISIISDAGNNKITFQVTGNGFPWTVITDATYDIEVNNGYFANRGGGVVFTLPSTASVGDTFIITNINAGGFSIKQNAGQTIYIGDQSTTTGVDGIVSSTSIGDSVILTCSIADTDFWATTPPQGIMALT